MTLQCQTPVNSDCCIRARVGYYYCRRMQSTVSQCVSDTARSAARLVRKEGVGVRLSSCIEVHRDSPFSPSLFTSAPKIRGWST
ncbi:hypothetical protein E2C01_007478 [Portunus trituberculatus]|uniref:Uncharacterized protein n=1 Tax=Portunus trituberculatus TaxID=210409 RepID=A0A5B7CY06_PORTR|nr:hypothetical protein [Portunus trituberculatus]